MFTGFEKTSILIKQNPIIFVWHFSFLSDKNFQTVVQLSSNYSEVFAKTDKEKYLKANVSHSGGLDISNLLGCFLFIQTSCFLDNSNNNFYIFAC